MFSQSANLHIIYIKTTVLVLDSQRYYRNQPLHFWSLFHSAKRSSVYPVGAENLDLSQCESLFVIAFPHERTQMFREEGKN